jgi:probable HAF family extracellular repeat protein
MRLITLLLLALACLGGVAQAAIPSKYEVIELGLLPDAGETAKSYAWGINNKGEVVGSATDASGNTRPVFWGPGNYKNPRDIGVFTGSYSADNGAAYGINNGSYVVGYAEDGSFGRVTYIPFLWDPVTGILRKLAALGRGDHGEANGINISGKVAGAISPMSSSYSPYLFELNHDPLPLSGDALGKALGINDSGQMVGYLQGAATGNVEHAFLWNVDTNWVDLDRDGVGHSRANAINNSGEVTGYINTGPSYNTPQYRAFIWDKFKGRRVLGTLGGEQSKGNGINNQGQLVGWADTADDWAAFIYEAGNMVNLNTLLLNPGKWWLHEALGINDKGEIVGWGRNNDDYFLTPRAFLLRPVKSPISAANNLLLLTTD